jgi:WD40 repeat protein
MAEYKWLRNVTQTFQYANFTDHYQCHDLLVAHPEVEELIYTIGDRCLFAINTDPLVKEKQIKLRGPNNAIHFPETPMSIAASKKYLAVGYHSGRVEFYDINKRTYLFDWQTNRSMVNYLDFYYEEGRPILLTATNNDAVIAYDVDNKVVRYVVTLPNSANGVKISPDNRTVAVTSDNSSVYFFAPLSEEVRGEITPIKEVSLFNPTAQSISWDPTSRYVAFACEGDNSCVVYDMELKKIIRRYLRPLPVRIVKFNHSLESPLLLIAEDTKTITIVDYIPDFQEAIQANDPNLPCVRQNTVKEPWHGPYHPSGICFSKSGTKLYWAWCTTANTWEDGGDFYGIWENSLGSIKSLKDTCIQFIRSTLDQHRAHYKGIRKLLTPELFAQINIKTTQ